MVKEVYARTSHDLLRDGIDFAVHHKLFVLGELHEDDPEVGSAQVERQELAVLGAVRQFTDVGGETLDTGLVVGVHLQPELDGLSHLLLHHVDVIVVEQEVPDTVFDQPKSPGR